MKINISFKEVFILILNFYILNGFIYSLNLIFTLKFLENYIFFLSLFFSLCIQIYLFKYKNFLQNFLLSIIIFFSVFIICKYIIFFDWSADSITAHKKLYYIILNGWNPFFDWSIDFKLSPDKSLNADYNAILAFKGMPLMLTPIMKFFDDSSVSISNSLSYFFFLIYIFYSHKFCQKFINRYKKGFFFVLVTNPIVLGLLGSNYFGIYFAVSLIIILYFFLDTLKNNKINNIDFFILLQVCIVVSSTKLNSFFFINFIIFFSFIFLLLKLPSNEIKYQIVKFKFPQLIIYFLIILTLNFNPLYPRIKDYIKSGFSYDKLLYWGKTAAWTQQANFINNNNRFTLFFASIFSPSEVLPNKFPKIKEKFTKIIQKKELRTWTLSRPTDIRAGGFGPLFGLCLVFAFIYLAYRSNFFLKLKLNKQFFIFFIIIFLSIVPVRVPIIARHVPQAYFFLVLIVAIIINTDFKKNIIDKIFHNLILGFAILNSVIIFLSTLVWLYVTTINSHQDKKYLEKIFNNKDKVYVNTFNNQGTLIQHDIYKKIIFLKKEEFRNICFITFKIGELDLCVETFQQNELNNENRHDLIKLYCERSKKFRFSRDSEISSKFIRKWKKFYYNDENKYLPVCS